MGGLEKTNDNDADDDIDSVDAALLEMLGLDSMDVKVDEECEHHDNDEQPCDSSVTINSNYPQDHYFDKLEQRDVSAVIQSRNLREDYQANGVCFLPSTLSVPSALMRRLTDELVWGGDSIRADKTYETISVLNHKTGEIFQRRTLTRLENFVDHHQGWKTLCHGYLAKCISALLGQEMVLFKEKLNLKPPGGSGFAPHLDGPSLRIALDGSDDNGPKSFVTVMVAIDNMTSQNGCLRLCKGPWREDRTCEVVLPEPDGNPDAGGRAGAISATVADDLNFEDLCCDGGSIAAFGEWTPHRSGANGSAFPRRAVFLTYNPAVDGDYHQKYYEKMEAMRNEWRSKIGLTNRNQWEHDFQRDVDALATIPKI